MEILNKFYTFAGDVLAPWHDAFAPWQWALGGSVSIWLASLLINKSLKRFEREEAISDGLKIAIVLVFCSFLAWQARYERLLRLELARPYFDTRELHLQEMPVVNKPGLFTNKVLRLKFVNTSTERSATKIVGDVVVIRDDFSEPVVLVQAIETVNDVGPGGDLNIGSTELNLGQNAGPLYVFSRIRYSDGIAADKEYQQVWYNKWTGVQPGGVFVSTLFQVDRKEKSQIEPIVRRALRGLGAF